MAPSTQILCSFALTFGVPMALAAREYLGLAMSGGSLPPHEPAPPPVHPLPDAGSPMAPAAGKTLPDCLIPKPVREFA